MADFDTSNLGAQLLQTQNPDQLYQRNSQYSNSGPYQTPLTPADELLFQNWVKTNKVPFDPSGKSDYDMRGFYNAVTSMDPRARTAINPNDNMMHFPDTWKTPFHQSFSNESQYSNGSPNAPRWVNDSQLATPSGQLYFDEKAR
jgi:hypothetical protein